MELTKEQKEWFGNRLHESKSGRVIVRKYLVDKYRKLTGDYKSLDGIIKGRIIEECF